MLNYIIRRILYMFVTLFFISIIGFILINLPPGSALDAHINQLRSQGSDLSLQQINQLKAQYGLDDPIQVKYFKWITGVLHGDFGQSFVFNSPVGPLIAGRLVFTLIMSVSALIFSWCVAIPIGVYSATHRYNIPDYVITVLQFIGVAVPEFLLALILLVFASNVLGQDVGGLNSNQYQNAPWNLARFVDFLKHVWIPVVVIAAASTAFLTRIMRANLLDVLNYQYIQTARSKGLKESIVIWKHAVRNALHPLVMSLGTTLPGLLGGEAIVSIVLNLPADGPLYLTALQDKDMYLAITFLLFSSVLLVVGNLLADILLVWIDPRIRLD